MSRRKKKRRTNRRSNPYKYKRNITYSNECISESVKLISLDEITDDETKRTVKVIVHQYADRHIWLGRNEGDICVFFFEGELLVRIAIRGPFIKAGFVI